MHCKDENHYYQFIDTIWYQSEFRWLALGDRGSLVASCGVNLEFLHPYPTCHHWDIFLYFLVHRKIFQHSVLKPGTCKVRKDDLIIKPIKSESELLNSTLRTGSNFCVTLGKPQFYIYNTEIIFHSLPPNTFIKRPQLLIFYRNNKKCVMIMHN